MKEFLKRKNIEVSARRYGIDALGAMAQGLFCSLLIGTIIKTLGQQLGLDFLVEMGGFATAMSAPAMAVAKPPISVRKSSPSCWPKVLMMVPISREQNRPWAMAPRASMP